MLVTNQTYEDFWFGPLHLAAGVGQTLTVDDTTETSLYLTDDVVADAINNLYQSGHIAVSGAALPFPRPTGVPQLVHGDGSPDGRIFAPQGSAYLRRDNTGGSSSLYVKTTGITTSTGWLPISTDTIAAPPGIIQPYAAASAPSGWLICDGSAVSRSLYSALFAVIATTYGSGDGSTTFNLPDIRGRVTVGYAASGGHADVSALGNNEGSTLSNRRPKHPHSVSDPGHQHNLALDDGVADGSSGVLEHFDNRDQDSYAVNFPGPGNAAIQAATTGISVGASGTSNDAPAYIVINHIIKT
jgi:microcystin-dependent protein